MMMNLFTMFDPSTSLGSWLGWSALSAGIFFLPYRKWVLSSRLISSFESVLKGLFSEMSALLGPTGKFLAYMFMALFWLILFNNLLGLLPFVFTSTAHLAVTLSLALPLWLGFYLFGWVTKSKHMLAHLVPQGTPTALMPFMVLIETLSGLIRPGTLAVRLAANMIAGHLLLALMSGAVSIFSPVMGVAVITTQVGLVVLELAVAAIQSYVFVILSTLYVSEI